MFTFGTLCLISHNAFKNLLQSCQLHSLAKAFGILTAQHRNSPSENTGFIFSRCNITGLPGGTDLGRPWGPYSRVIFGNTFMSNTVSPEGWRDWDDPRAQRCKTFCSFLFKDKYTCM